MMGQVEKSEIDQEFEPAGEARWPAAGAVLAAIGLTLLLPDGERVGPGWLLPAIEVVLLAAIVASDPGRINRRSRLLRGLSIALVAVLVLGALSSTLLLIDALIHGGPETNSAGDAARRRHDGVGVQQHRVRAAVLGARRRRRGRSRASPAGTPRLRVPAAAEPRRRPAGWRPRFVDYLYLGFTNAIAFSPTDAMPLVPWAKVAMTVQSLVSLGILGLVIARAVNVFT